MREYLYGMNPVFEALRASRRRVYRAWMQDGTENSPRQKKLAALLERAGVPVERADKRRLFDLCQSTEHQAIVLETGEYPYVAFATLTACRRLVLLDNVEDPHNVGAILRSAEVFGWSDVALSSRGVPRIYASVVKASAGATEHLRIGQEYAANDYLKRLKNAGFKVVALDAAGKESVASIDFAALEPGVLVIGGEHQAVGQYILNRSDHVVTIPQRGRVSSLNASVAAGIAMYALGARRDVPPAERLRVSP